MITRKTLIVFYQILPDFGSHHLLLGSYLANLFGLFIYRV